MVGSTGNFPILCREAMIACYCSVLTKSINCVLQSSSCRFSNNRALQNSIVRIIPINGRSPKAVVPTISIHVHHPKSIVYAIPINRQLVKTNFRTISINRQSPRSFVWIIPFNRQPVKTIFRTIPNDRQSPRSFVWTIPIN